MTDVGVEVLDVAPFAGSSVFEPEANGADIACESAC